MARYDLLVDGERKARVKDEDEVRQWVAQYREQHTEDDPSAAHVQIVRVRFMGGKLIPRERFL